MTMRIIFGAVRESEGECAWECCEPKNAEAWQVVLVAEGGDVRSWAYKSRAVAAIACRDLCEGRSQPLNVTRGMATIHARCIYLP